MYVIKQNYNQTLLNIGILTNHDKIEVSIRRSS